MKRKIRRHIKVKSSKNNGYLKKIYSCVVSNKICANFSINK